MLHLKSHLVAKVSCLEDKFVSLYLTSFNGLVIVATTHHYGEVEGSKAADLSIHQI